MGRLLLDASLFSIAPSGSSYQWKIDGVVDGLTAASGQSVSEAAVNGSTVELTITHPNAEPSTDSQRLPLFDFTLAPDWNADTVEVTWNNLQLFNTNNSHKKEVMYQFYQTNGTPVESEGVISYDGTSNPTTMPSSFVLNVPSALQNQGFVLGIRIKEFYPARSTNIGTCTCFRVIKTQAGPEEVVADIGNIEAVE